MATREEVAAVHDVLKADALKLVERLVPGWWQQRADDEVAEHDEWLQYMSQHAIETLDKFRAKK